MNPSMQSSPHSQSQLIQVQLQSNGHIRSTIVDSELDVIATQPDVVTSQPQAGEISASSAKFNYPPGLLYLSQLDELSVEPHKVPSSCGMNIEYDVKNASGKDVFWAIRDDDCLSTYCAGMPRLRVLDYFRNEIIQLDRVAFCRSIKCCGANFMEISVPSDQLIGMMGKKLEMCSFVYFVKNPMGEQVLRIKVKTGFCSPDYFNVFTMDGTQVAQIIQEMTFGPMKVQFFMPTDNTSIENAGSASIAQNDGIPVVEEFTNSGNSTMNMDIQIKVFVLGFCLMKDCEDKARRYAQQFR